MLKDVIQELHPFEEQICRFLSSDWLIADPSTVPILDILKIPHSPGRLVIAMPLLPRTMTSNLKLLLVSEKPLILYNNFRRSDEPESAPYNALIITQGLQFMHKRGVAHR